MSCSWMNRLQEPTLYSEPRVQSRKWDKSSLDGVPVEIWCNKLKTYTKQNNLNNKYLVFHLYMVALWQVFVFFLIFYSTTFSVECITNYTTANIWNSKNQLSFNLAHHLLRNQIYGAKRSTGSFSVSRAKRIDSPQRAGLGQALRVFVVQWVAGWEQAAAAQTI